MEEWVVGGAGGPLYDNGGLTSSSWPGPPVWWCWEGGREGEEWNIWLKYGKRRDKWREVNGRE